MFLTDEEMEMIESGATEPQQGATEIVHQPQEPMPIQLYPLSIAGGAPLGTNGAPNGAPNGAMPDGGPPQGWALRQYGGVPVWAWGLIGLTGAAAGLFYWRGKQPKANGKGDDEPSPNIAQALMGGGESRGGWSPSRGRMAEQLERYFKKKGVSQNVKVWHDADDAQEKGGLKQVSPLVNVEVKSKGFKVDAAFTKFCRREGLNPVQHNDGNIGLYPHSTKRGKEWEEYTDALRDEGQKV
jgi:hypothetical protein